MLTDVRELRLRGGDGVRLQLLQRLQRHLEDLVQAHVAETPRDLAVLRERTRVRRRVHLRHQRLEQLQAEHQVARRRVQEAANLVHDLLLILHLRPAKLGRARHQLHQQRRNKIGAHDPIGRQKVERVVAVLSALRGREMVPRLHDELLERVGGHQLRLRHRRTGEHKLALRDMLWI